MGEIGFDGVGPDYVRRQPGHVEEVDWSEVGLGSIVRGKGDRMHTITRDEQGWLELKAVKDGQRAVIKRPTSGKIGAYIPSDDEALVLLNEGLGARMLQDIEMREHTIARALNWRMEPVPRKAQVLQNHLDMIHGIKVDDVVRKNQGTKANPATRKTKADTLEELVLLHDEAHNDPDLWPMAFPHVHTLDPKEVNR